MISDRSLEHRLSEIERRLDDMRTSQLQLARVGAGGVTIADGGKLTVLDGSDNVLAEFDVNGVEIFEADGSTLVTLDGTGIRLNDGSGTKLIDLTTSGLQAYEADGSTLVTLDGSKLRFNRSDGTKSLEVTPAGGLKIYDTDGTTEKVVLDSTGLTIEGGQAKAIDVQTKEDSFSGTATLTTSFTELTSLSFTVPSWALTAQVMGFGTIRAGNGGTGTYGILASTRVDDVNDGSNQQDVAVGETATAVHVEDATLTGGSLGSTIKVSIYGARSGGSQDESCQPGVWALAVFTR